MKKIPAVYAALAFAFILGVTAFAALSFLQNFFQEPECFTAESVTPVFSPGSASALIALIDNSKNSIDVMVYQFSYAKLRDALVNAAARGVRVRLILEPKVDSNLDTGAFLAARGVAVRWASQKYYNTHAKFAVFDNECVFVGSTNWSRAAFESNREAAVNVCSARIALKFEKVFESDWVEATSIAQ